VTGRGAGDIRGERGSRRDGSGQDEAGRPPDAQTSRVSGVDGSTLGLALIVHEPQGSSRG